jgi:hypothetical protein
LYQEFREAPEQRGLPALDVKILRLHTRFGLESREQSRRQFNLRSISLIRLGVHREFPSVVRKRAA